VHLETENDYILPLNLKAVLKESLYSDTVYTAEGITSEGILTDTFSESDDEAWTTWYKFIYAADCTSERRSESNLFGNTYVTTGTVFPDTGTPKKLIYKSKKKIFFF